MDPQTQADRTHLPTWCHDHDSSSFGQYHIGRTVSIDRDDDRLVQIQLMQAGSTDEYASTDPPGVCLDVLTDELLTLDEARRLGAQLMVLANEAHDDVVRADVLRELAELDPVAQQFIKDNLKAIASGAITAADYLATAKPVS